MSEKINSASVTSFTRKKLLRHEPPTKRTGLKKTFVKLKRKCQMRDMEYKIIKGDTTIRRKMLETKRETLETREEKRERRERKRAKRNARRKGKSTKWEGKNDQGIFEAAFDKMLNEVLVKYSFQNNTKYISSKRDSIQVLLEVARS